MSLTEKQLDRSAELSVLLGRPEVAPSTDYAPLPLGITHGVPSAQYHAKRLGLVSNTALDKFAHAPLLYRTWLDAPDVAPSAAFALGSALHCAALEPLLFADLYVVEPSFGDCRKTANKSARDEWRARNTGRSWLSAEDMAAIDGMCRSLRAHPVIGPLLDCGHSEVTAVWDDPESGLRCKARADRWSPDFQAVLDLKTTDDARPGAFARSCEQYGYDRQEAHYRRGFGACDAPVEYFIFGAVEKTAPYLCAAYTLHAESVAEADALNRGLMARLAECVRSDTWPGLQAGIPELRLRAWSLER